MARTITNPVVEEFDASPQAAVTPAVQTPFTVNEPLVQRIIDVQFAMMMGRRLQVTCLGPCLRSYSIAHNQMTGTCVYCQGETTKPVVVGECIVHSPLAWAQLNEASSLTKIQRESARALWVRLHKYAVDNQTTWSQAESQTFLDQWTSDVDAAFPPTGCSCGNYLAAYTDKHPPIMATAKEFFEWGYLLHEAVNAKLGKPDFSRADAIAMYGVPSAWNFNETQSINND